MKLCRHYLVEITNQGRLDAYQNLGSDYASARSKLIEALIMNERIPGILRRAEEGYRKKGGDSGCRIFFTTALWKGGAK